MENKDKKSYTLDEIMEETRLNDPQQYDAIMLHGKIKSNLLDKYKKTANIPEFITHKEYYQWLETPEGKKHTEAIESINKQTNTEYKKQHGGRRTGSGRKKSTVNKVKFTPAIPVETRSILKEFAKFKGIPESEILNTLILYGCKPDSPVFNS